MTVSAKQIALGHMHGHVEVFEASPEAQLRLNNTAPPGSINSSRDSNTERGDFPRHERLHYAATRVRVSRGASLTPATLNARRVASR